jgi:hypothetical protein
VKQSYTITKSQFSEFLIKQNSLDTFGFHEWVFYRGMFFNDLHAWWGGGGVRCNPHEGLDFCFYRDRDGLVLGLDAKTKIPLMYEGKIVLIHDDFLGKSIYVSHDMHDGNMNILHTIYGHTVPLNTLHTEKTLSEGEIIATISDAGMKKNIHPHVHVTVAWLPESFAYEKLNWEVLCNPHIATLCNPLEFINCKYRAV